MFDVNTFKTCLTTSSAIRYAGACGLTRSQIVKAFKEHRGKEIRYQHVRNVLLQEPKKKEVTKMTAADL